MASDVDPRSRRRGFFGMVFDLITSRTTATRSKYREVAAIFNALRGPIVVSLLGFVVFALPGQVLEIYRLFAEDFNITAIGAAANVRFAIFMAMLWLTGYVLWYVSRIITLNDPIAFEALNQEDIDGTVARWLPRWLGALPCWGAAIGLARTGFQEPLFLTDLNTRSMMASASAETVVLYGAAAMAFIVGGMRLWSSWRRTKINKTAYEDLRRTPFRMPVRVLLTVALLGMIAFLMTQPVAFTQWVGALSLIGFFMIALTFGLSFLNFLYDRYALPAVALLFCGAIAFSVFDMNDNHYARQMPLPLVEVETEASAEETSDQAAPLPKETLDPPGDVDVRTAFEQWLESRADRQAYIDAGKPYPVYMVAAQGGGLYAAYQTAIFLARIQDACPAFAQHVFGVSGVSGGSVGATVFSSLAQRFAENATWPVGEPCGVRQDWQKHDMENMARDMLSQDFLSPLVGALLFGDFTARFLPFPVNAFDRARALEFAFEDAWEKTGALGDSPLKEGVLSYWRPDGAAPALFINTTEAGSGRRFIISPIQQLGPELRSYAELAVRPGAILDDDPGLLGVPRYVPRGEEQTPPPPLDMPLSTAMVLSARFPYITPAGSLDVMQEVERGRPLEPRKTRLVDGTYFENSGIDTAMDVIRKVERVVQDKNVDLRLIVFDLTADAFAEPSYALGELLSPIHAILNARVSRSEIAQQTARRDFTRDGFRSECRYLLVGGAAPWKDDEDCPPSELAASRVWSVSLNDYEFDFQLGWILSQDTLARIEQQLGDPRDCGVRDGPALRSLQRRERVERPVSATPVALGAGRAPQRSGDGSVLRDVAAIELTRDEQAIESHNGCIADFILRAIERR